MIRTVGKAIALLIVYGTALQLGLAVYSTYRYTNVSKIIVSKLSDLDEVFEVGASSARVKNPEFLVVCFAGDYVYSLQDAKHWFVGNEGGFDAVLEGVGGTADSFNGVGQSSIVLLSRSSAVILQFDLRTEFLVKNLGCAGADNDLEIKRYESNTSTELYLPSATLKAPRGPQQPPVTLCGEKLERFVVSIDDLLAKNKEISHEAYWAVTRKYLPATACVVDEVFSISSASRFFEPRKSGTDSTVRFRNADVIIMFRLERDTGTIDRPDVSSTHLPSL
jgi:hypothetical protein